jgi:5-methylcytosine-specific restriction protein A
MSFIPDLNEIRPLKSQRIYDLVKDAGVDVSDWSNFKGGAKKAASNPKYCYEWSFVEPGKVVVLNLWYNSMEIRAGKIVQDLDMRNIARSQEQLPYKGAVVKRAQALDQALQVALRDQIPIRVVVCEGSRRNPDDPNSKASKVEMRLLDPEPWAVTAYDWATGKCTVTRGEGPVRFVDQFESYEPLTAETEQKIILGKVYTRNPEVRKRVLARAAGSCEWCGTEGFRTHDDRIYLETHHIKPLSGDGEDSELNVVALCPNHHREAHFGKDRDMMAKALIDRVTQKYAEQSVLGNIRPIARASRTETRALGATKNGSFEENRNAK